MENIRFCCYKTFSTKDDKDYTLFLFYPEGVWDEDKLLVEDAYSKYPPSKYNWIAFDIDEHPWVTTGTA